MTNWNKYKLSQITEIIGGGTPKTSVTEHWNGSIPWLSVVDFAGDKKKVYQTEKTITEQGLKNSSTKILKKGQLIISARGTVGELAMLGKDMAFNQSCYGLNAIPNVTTNEFLYYLLKYKIDSLKAVTHGSVFDTITRQTFEQIEVLIPKDLKVQQRIASILSSLDDKIELNRRMNQTLEQIAATLFKKYFVDDIDPDNLPEGWSESRLGDEVEITSSKRIFLNEYVSEGIPFYRGKEIIELNRTGVISNELFITEEKFNNIKHKFGVPKEGDILITSVGTIGVPYLVNDKDCFYFKDGNLTWIKKYYNFLSPYYLYQWLFSDDGQDKIENIKIGSTQQAITIQSLKTIKILVPPKSLHDQTVSKLEVIRKKIVNNIVEIKTLMIIRDTLLPKLMSGEIDITAINQNEPLNEEVLI